MHPEIRTLQKFLKKTGYLNYRDTAIFGELTKAALKKYQTAKNLTNKNGVMDAETRVAMVADLLSEWKLTETNSLSVAALEKELAELKK